MKSIEYGVMGLGCLTLLDTLFLYAIMYPLIAASFSYFGISLFISWFPDYAQLAVDGMHSLGLKEVTLSQLPNIAACLAFVGSYFKSTQTNTNKTK